MVQYSYPYMPTGKIIALTRWTFVGKVMSVLLNMLSRLVITFLPRSKRLLISWLQSLSAVILEPLNISLIFIPLYIMCPVSWTSYVILFITGFQRFECFSISLFTTWGSVCILNMWVFSFDQICENVSYYFLQCIFLLILKLSF